MIKNGRTRILIITRNLPPLIGGMERLNWHMTEELSRYADVRVVGPEGAAAKAPAGVPVMEVPLRPLWFFLLRAYVLAQREARSWKPDVVLAGSGLTAPLAHAAVRACCAQTAVYVHGLDVAVKHFAYRTIWLPSLRRMGRVIANSCATAALCRTAEIDPTRIGIVHPGVTLPDNPEPAQIFDRSIAGQRGWDPESSCSMKPDVAAVNFREHYNLGDRPLLLSVGRLSARKGIREFVANVLPRISAKYPKVVLLVVGDAPKDALHAEAQTPDSIRATAERAGVAGNLRFIGMITDYKELEVVYRAADVHVFPVRHLRGDPEGFGMVAVEAAVHGLPTVAFATGGIVDAVADGRSGYLVAPGDYAAFAETVLRVLADPDALRTGTIEFAQQFAWPKFGVRLVAELAHVVPDLVSRG
jgi:phosphatidylinositol alpha-1,6-mannosyltransferase